jgi:diadenosine tetraphosphate (Ap4A) HIT family hydrolase
MSFTLHPQIEADSFFICDLPLCQVRLENVRNFPWLILVPRLSDISEVHQLSKEQQTQLIAESSLCAQALLAQFELHKINVGALGNLVPQLHWHVVGRKQDDDAWPKPVWGFANTDPWCHSEAETLCLHIKKMIIANSH